MKRKEFVNFGDFKGLTRMGIVSFSLKMITFLWCRMQNQLVEEELVEWGLFPLAGCGLYK